MPWNLDAGRTPEILLVEDNPDDVLLTRLVLDRLACPVRVHDVPDGDACLAFLRRAPPWTAAPAVDLVLLDLNLPGLDGRGVLAALAADPMLRPIPVVVLTTSASEADVRATYALGCSGYVVKPCDLKHFFETMDQVCHYWFSAVRLPRPGV